MGTQFSQVFPPRPTFTAANIPPSQQGRVFLITGGTSGIGFELARTLYTHGPGSKVYITARTEEKARSAIAAIKASLAELDFILLELSDLVSIKESVEAFGKKEDRLDILFNNAGVSQPPVGSVSAQGYELQLAVNCLGPFLLTKLLLPLLQVAAATPATLPESEPGLESGSGSESGCEAIQPPRVLWTSSQVAELSSHPEGILISDLTNPPNDPVRNYTTSKVGNWFLAGEFARRYGGSGGIISVALNPGATNTNLFRTAKIMKLLAWPLLHNAKDAACTALFAAFSPEISLQNHGRDVYVIPFGRVHGSIPTRLVDAMKGTDEGGTGRAGEVWGWCEEQIREYY
ncbi:hypothetical protein BDW74DRAFT_170075 [Aspergillus multicolor]|uniref:uncharacterized protein n=1 Tax=Aspergillus multicolor TaxID=41759 RepID=UPI003CCDD846